MRCARRVALALGTALALLLVPPALASDTPSAPTPLSFGSPAYFDTSGYGIASGEQNTTAPFSHQCGAPYSVGVARTAWFTVQGTGGPITVTTAGSNYDTAMFVYAGSPAGAVVTCNDDSSSEIQAAVAFSSTAGATYAIQVGRACNEQSGSNCAAEPSAGDLTIRAEGTAPAVPPTPGPDGETPPAPPAPPPAVLVENRLAPSIGGVAVRSALLSCARGEWLGPQPLTYTAEWLRNGKVVGRGLRYRVVAADVNRRLVCKVTASGQGASASAVSEGVTPLARRSSVALIRSEGGVGTPRGAAPRKACRGQVALTLRKGAQVLGRHTVRLTSKCRWSWTWQVNRKRIGKARRLQVLVRFAGNIYLLPVSGLKTVRVPRSK